MIMLDPEQGREAPETGRLLTYCDPYNGRLYDLPITSFVVLTTMQHLEELGMEIDDSDAITQYSGQIAELLVMGGWFTEDEFIANLAKEEAEDADDELRRLLGGE